MPVQLDESSRRRVGPVARLPSRRLFRRLLRPTPKPHQWQQQPALQRRRRGQRRQRAAVPARCLLQRPPGFLSQGLHCSSSDQGSSSQQLEPQTLRRHTCLNLH